MTMVQAGKHAHKLVAETAENLAEEMFEKLMSVPGLYNKWKSDCPDLTPEALRARFVRMMVPKLLPQARAILAGVLGRPGDETLKRTIHEALLLDWSLSKGRRAN